MTHKNDPKRAHQDWPVPTAEDMELLRTVKDGDALQQHLDARLLGEGVASGAGSREEFLKRAVDKGVLSEAGRVLLNAADEAREKMKGRPAFGRTDRNWPVPTIDNMDLLKSVKDGPKQGGPS